MDGWKKVGRFFCSMKCALLLLLILVAACVAGSVITQGQVSAYYTVYYPAAAAQVILLFGLDDVFHCWWFVVLTLFLCANLILCNVSHFPALIQRTKDGFTLEKRLREWDGTATVTVNAQPEELFKSLGFHKVQTVQAEGRECLYGVRHQIGIWGAWATHLGMLIVIAGFALGQIFQSVYTVYGVPGQTKAIGETGYELTIHDFQILLREDETVDQYVTDLSVTDGTETKSGQTSVNSPLSLFGMKFYQNSTGWAATIKVWKGEDLLQEEVLCAGEYLEVEGVSELEIGLSAFYPDYYLDASGTPATASSQLLNPGYFYRLYYQGQILGMNVLTGDDVITVDDYTFAFENPQQYTLIQIKSDPFGSVAAVGGVVILIALILAFYVRPEELWAVRGEDGSWAVAGKSRKGGSMYQDEIIRKGEAFQKKCEGGET